VCPEAAGAAYQEWVLAIAARPPSRGVGGPPHEIQLLQGQHLIDPGKGLMPDFGASGLCVTTLHTAPSPTTSKCVDGSCVDCRR
jgi:hypothetical protein